MDRKAEAREFLMSRRARTTPEQVGLLTGGTRRVPGLRRHEVAVLAGVSVEYYTRLERGNLAGVSDSVLDALAQALRLDDTERAHLHRLARAAGPSVRRPVARVPSAVRPGVQRMIDALDGLPALVTNSRFDVLAANALGRALYAPVLSDPACGDNTARFVFLSPHARRFYLDWQSIAQTAVGALRVEAAKDPYDRSLSNLIGELSTRSDAFRQLWAAHEVRVFRDGTKRFDHPAVGHLELDHETLLLGSDISVVVAVYSAQPGSGGEDALKLLASWAATADTAGTTVAARRA